MRRFLFLIVLFFWGTSGIAQIKKHSFGANINNTALGCYPLNNI